MSNVRKGQLLEDSIDEESVEELVEESDKEEASDLEFINSAYEHSDVDEIFLEKDDKAFDNSDLMPNKTLHFESQSQTFGLQITSCIRIIT